MLAVIALAGLRAWWGYEAQRRLDAVIDAAHARGEAIVPHDFANRVVPTDANAAVPIARAAQKIKLSPAEETFDDSFDPRFAPSASDIAVMKGIVDAYPTALADVRAARAMRRAQWSTPLSSPVVNSLLRHLGPTRDLCVMLMYASMYRHAIGDEAEAIELVRDRIHVAAAIDDSTVAMVCHHFTSWQETRACEDLARFAATLNVASEANESRAAPPRAGHGASREQLRELITDLVDESEFQRGFVRGWFCERMMWLDYQLTIGPKVIPLAEARSLLAPMHMLNGLRTVDYYDKHIAAATRPSYPAAVAASPPSIEVTRESELEYDVKHVVGQWGTMPQSYVLHFAAVAARRMAAVALAIRLYKIDHGDAFPRTLDELAPAYLKAVPADPFRADGKALGYRADRRFIYSVGLDGVDDGGGAGTPGVDRWKDKDAVFPLTAPPATRPATRGAS